MSHLGQRFLCPFYSFVMEIESLNAVAWVVPAIAAAGSLISGLLNRKSQSDSNEQNQKNFEKQFAENQRQFNMNYRQQSILNQLREMRAAGVNPASANVGVASSPSSGGGSQLPNILPENGFAMGLEDMALKSAQVGNITANTRKTNEESKGVEYTNEILASDAKFRDAYNQGTLNLQSAQTELAWSTTNRTDTLTPLEASQMRANTSATLQSIDNMKADIDRINAYIGNLDSQNKLNDSKIKEINQSIKESISREYFNYKQSHKLDKDMEYLDKLMESLDVSIQLDHVKLSMDGLDLELRTDDGGQELLRSIIKYDQVLLPQKKLNEVILPWVHSVSSGVSAAVKYLK